MLLFLLIFIAGIAIGLILKSWKKVIPVTNFLILLNTLILLFILGISIGERDDVFSNIPQLGFQALIMAILIVSFSIVMVNLTGIVFKKKHEK